MQIWRVGELMACVDLQKTWKHTCMMLQNSGRSSHTTSWMTRKAEQFMPCSSRNVTAKFCPGFPWVHDLMALRIEGTGGNRTAALLRGIFNPRVRLEKMKNEGRDFGEVHVPWEKDVAQYRVAAGADLRQAVRMATVMEHAAAAHLWSLESGSLGKS